jgi:hypothetical protein
MGMLLCQITILAQGVLTKNVRGNISNAMQFFGAELTKRINRVHDWDRPIFKKNRQGRSVYSTIGERTSKLMVMAHSNQLKTICMASGRKTIIQNDTLRP